MTTPPKYEDLVLKVAELERREATSLNDLSIWKQKACEAAGRESALREELERVRSRYDREVLGLNNEGDPIGGDPAGGYKNDNARLQQRLTVAEKALRDVRDSGDWHSSALEFIPSEGFEVLAKIEAALKPAAEGEGS